MGSGIYVAVSGAVSQKQALDVIANNVANSGTVGFKAQRTAFETALKGEQTKELAFVGTAATDTDSTAGNLIQTQNPLDLALVGDGYFSVNTPRGVRYTRAGNFRLDPRGQLVNGQGFAARSSSGGAITVPTDAATIAIDAKGTVTADGEEVGQLALARVASTDLIREGADLFGAKRTGGAVDASTEVVSGALEGSNVNVVRGVVDLVQVSRTYEALMSMIEAYKAVDDRTARSLGGPK